MSEVDKQIKAMEQQLKTLKAERLGKEIQREKVYKLSSLKQLAKHEAKAVKKTKVPSLAGIERKRKLKRIGGGLWKGLKFAGREVIKLERSKEAKKADKWILYGSKKKRVRRVK